MKRNYRLMRRILVCIGNAKRPLEFEDLFCFDERRQTRSELDRLSEEGLLVGGFRFGQAGEYLGGTIDGLTDDGRSLLRDIESDDVWKICLDTLEGADVDLSYPLLKDVCETIVKRYVESFIPNKIGR